MLLTEQEKAEITQAIKEAEKQTSCEIVVTEIGQCDDYNSARFLWGLIFGLVVGSLIGLLYPTKGLATLFAVLIGINLGHLVSFIPSLKRLLIPKRKIQNEVHYRARAEFYEQGLYKTREENGILIMLSAFERMVVILADKGVNTKMPPDYWETMKNKIITGIKQKKGGAAIVEVIKSMTDNLKTHFPVKPDDKDELSDNVISKT